MANKISEKPKQSNKKQLPHLRILDSTIRESANLSDAAFRVYFILRFHRNAKTGICNPTVQTIREETALGKKSVERAITELVEKGWIFRKSGNGPGNSNSYTFPSSAITFTNESAPESVNNNGSDTPPVASSAINEAYLDKKQQERPDLDIKAVYKKFREKIESGKYQFLKHTVRAFDKFVATEDVGTDFDITDLDVLTDADQMKTEELKRLGLNKYGRKSKNLEVIEEWEEYFKNNPPK